MKPLHRTLTPPSSRPHGKTAQLEDISDTEFRAAVGDIAAQFSIGEDTLKHGLARFLEQCRTGLDHDVPRNLPMIPTFVTKVPTGHEKGIYLAADLGGTNFRVCSVHLQGNGTYAILQEKAPIPHELFTAPSSHELFAYMARRINAFVSHHLSEKFASEMQEPDHLKLGFTFSFPVEQTDLNRGTLLRWTKGFDIPDTVGKDVVQLLQQEIDALSDLAKPVRVVALANDTVGTLMCRAYSSASAANKVVLGAIFGTGTNGAYVEQLQNVHKLFRDEEYKQSPYYGRESAAGPEDVMVINTEWGSFDNDLTVLPRTPFDDAVDASTPNQGYHMFEKRVSGMFLGEILRQTLAQLLPKIPECAALPGVTHVLQTPWSLDTKYMSRIQIGEAEPALREVFQLEAGQTLPHDVLVAAQVLTRAIAKRSAYLAAIPIAGVLEQTGALKNLEPGQSLDVGADGSVVEHYPGFQQVVKEALTVLFGEQSRRIHLNIAKDGSGVGAALIASTVG